VYFVNYFIGLYGEVVDKAAATAIVGSGAEAVSWNVAYGWRWMFGSEAVPALALLLLLALVPESPRFLLAHGDEEKARRVLGETGGAKHAEDELREIEWTLAREKATIGQLFEPGMRVALMIGVALAILQQVTGINVFLYYAPEIFKQLGSASSAALLQTTIVGGVNLLFTVVAIYTVDRLGRKPLMLIGNTGMGVCLVAMGLAAFYEQTAAWMLLFILGYIACFALSVGPVTWVILSEIFPTKIRGRAMAIATVCLWVANYVVTQTFTIMDQDPWLVEHLHHALPFWIYAGFCVVSVVFIWATVPETKGRSLEDIERRWMGG